MKKPLYAILLVLIIFSGCDKEKEVIILDNQIPLVKSDSSYNIIKTGSTAFTVIANLTKTS